MYINDKLQGMIKPINDNIIEVVGLPLTSNGFTMYLDNDMAVGDYKAYTTLYRTIGEQVYQYSNNGSIYVEPEPIPIPEPYIPTKEELAEIARQEKIANIQSQISVIDAEFATLDYVASKIATGRATIEEYTDKIARMSELAIMKDALEEELKLV